jgi:hypothetical protein
VANYFDGKVNPNAPQNAEPNRYQNLGLEDAEPNLGLPDDDGYVLASDTLGNRTWVPSGMGPSSPFIPNDIINAKGDIIIGSTADTPSILSVAPDGCILISDSLEFLGVKWIDFTQVGVPLSLFEAKGSIAVAVSQGVVSNLNVGADGQIVIADSASPAGVKWSDLSEIGVPNSIFTGKGDLIVASSQDSPQNLPVGNDGEVLVADSTRILGVKWAPYGNPPYTIETLTVVTEVLTPGQDWDFWLDLGQLFSFISVSVMATPEDGWLRVYTSEAALLADSRVAPGPPLPALNSGFVTEVVTSPSEPSVVLLPVPQAFSEDGTFFRFTNQGAATQSFSIEVRFLRFVESPCNLPPYGNNIYVNPSCVQYLSSITGVLEGNTPSMIYSGGTTILGEASNSYNGFVADGSGTLGEFALSRGALGEISSISIFSGSGYEEGDFLIIQGSFIGGVNGADDVEIILSRNNGMELLGAWENGSLITNFPLLNVGNGVEFVRAWKSCTSLVNFPSGVFDTCLATNFTDAWSNCSLSQASVDNILISLDNAGQSGGQVNVDGGTSSAPGPAGLAAKASLQGKGWTIITN